LTALTDQKSTHLYGRRDSVDGTARSPLTLNARFLRGARYVRRRFLALLAQDQYMTMKLRYSTSGRQSYSTPATPARQDSSPNRPEGLLMIPMVQLPMVQLRFLLPLSAEGTQLLVVILGLGSGTWRMMTFPPMPTTGQGAEVCRCPKLHIQTFRRT
jgi:hypothetical protein